MELELKKQCNKSCSPSDFVKGGKCDKNGCFDIFKKADYIVIHDTGLDEIIKNEAIRQIREAIPGAVIITVSTQKP